MLTKALVLGRLPPHGAGVVLLRGTPGGTLKIPALYVDWFNLRVARIVIDNATNTRTLGLLRNIDHAFGTVIPLIEGDIACPLCAGKGTVQIVGVGDVGCYVCKGLLKVPGRTLDPSIFIADNQWDDTTLAGATLYPGVIGSDELAMWLIGDATVPVLEDFLRRALDGYTRREIPGLMVHVCNRLIHARTTWAVRFIGKLGYPLTQTPYQCSHCNGVKPPWGKCYYCKGRAVTYKLSDNIKVLRTRLVD